MNSTDLLTIAMPVYERRDFFEEALESALNQTVKCRIIVNDNCSSHDYFEKVCKKKGVTYYRNDRNIGMAANFAIGFKRAETEYAMNLQDDDKLDPQFVESFVKTHEKYPAIDIFFSDFLRLTPEGKKSHGHTLPFGYMENGNKVIEYGIKYKLGFPFIASVIKRDIVKDSLTKYGTTGSYDWLWLYSEADKFSFFGESKPLYLFRVHDNQDTRNNSLSYMLSIPYIYDRVLYEKTADPELKKRASKNAFRELIILKSVANKKALNEILADNNMYSNYLREKLNNNRRLKTIYQIPRGVVSLIFKILRKAGLTG